jgi:RNA recognition motif-containing protein
VVVKGFRLRVGWGTRDSRDDHLTPGSNKKKSTLTRNVYVGGIKDFDKYTEEKLRRDFSVYGEVEMINFLKEKAAAFVNL